MPQARVRTSTSPGPGSGVGTSATMSCLFRMTTARMMSLRHAPAAAGRWPATTAARWGGTESYTSRTRRTAPCSVS